MLRSLSLGYFLLATPALAQTAAPAPPLQPPTTLAEALKTTYWNAEQRGPLLAIAPKQAYLQQVPGSKTLPPLPPEQGYNATEISAYFDRVPLKAGGVTVLAPRTMRLFTRPTLPIEKAALLSREEAGRELLASLTKAQWQKLVSESGLGLSDLDEKQKPLFQPLIPTRMTLVQIDRDPDQPTAPPEPPRSLTELQIQSAKLRLARQLQTSYLIDGKENSFFTVGARVERYSLVAGYGSGRDDQDPLLTRLFPKVPNRLKSGALDFASTRLDPKISLVMVTTLGELLQRIGAATKLTLLADYRLSGLPLSLKGESARSGDLLQALCLGVCGAFRRIDTAQGTTFLLTEDREGLTTRLAAYDLWMQKVYELRQKQQEACIKKLRASGATIPIEDSADISPEALKKVADIFIEPPKGEERGIPLTVLPPRFQKRAEEAAARKRKFDEEGGSPTENIRTDRILLSAISQTRWVLPGLGSFPTYSLNLNIPMDSPLAAHETQDTRFDPRWKERVLVLAPQTVAQATEAVGLAKKARLTTLWVAVPLDVAKAKPLLDAALVAGKAVGIAVGAQLNTLVATAEPRFRDKLDQNPLGMALGPTPNLLPLAPTTATAQFFSECIPILAATPNLSALCLNGAFSSYRPNSSLPSHQALGYLPENRAAFLAQADSDILDVPHKVGSAYPIPLGYFSQQDGRASSAPSFHDRGRDWQGFRQRQLETFLKLLDPLMTRLPCPGYIPLTRADLLGLWKLPSKQTPQELSVMRPLHLLQLWDQAKPEDYVAALHQLQKNLIPTEGVVLDLSLCSWKEAQEILTQLISPKLPPVQ